MYFPEETPDAVVLANVEIVREQASQRLREYLGIVTLENEDDAEQLAQTVDLLERLKPLN